MSSVRSSIIVQGAVLLQNGNSVEAGGNYLVHFQLTRRDKDVVVTLD
jgi:hypothetical protein